MNEYVYVIDPPGDSELDENDVGHYVEQGESSSSIFFLRINQEIEIPNESIVDFDISETGDEFDYKVCDRCYKHLATSTNFSGNRIKKHGIVTNRPSCKLCRKEKDGKNISTFARDLWELKKPKDYTLFSCPICTKTTIAKISKIVLDHCHKTGKVRGYLCESCNTGIGRFDDDPELVARAKDWLEKTPK